MKRTILHMMLLITSSVSAQKVNISSPGMPTTVEQFVTALALKSSLTGSLVTDGVCVENRGVSTPLPHPPEGSFVNYEAALRSLSRIDKKLQWTRTSDGKVRIGNTRVGRDVLAIRLHNFRINAVDIGGAIYQITEAPEVRAYFADHSIQDGFVYNTFGLTKPNGQVRIELEMHNITVSGALDEILGLYPGIWIYRECMEGRTRRVMISGIQARFAK